MNTTVLAATPHGYGPSGHVPRISQLAHVGISVENLDTSTPPSPSIATYSGCRSPTPNRAWASPS